MAQHLTLEEFIASLKIASGAGDGKILTSDAAGLASWQTPAADVSDLMAFAFFMSG